MRAEGDVSSEGAPRGRTRSLAELLAELPPDEAEDVERLIDEAEDVERLIDSTTRPRSKLAWSLLGVALACLIAGVCYDAVEHVGSPDWRANAVWVRHGYGRIVTDPGGGPERMITETRDPWGKRYAYTRMPVAPNASVGRTYSCGPNGRDEQGRGDDVVLDYLTSGLEFWVARGETPLAILAFLFAWLGAAVPLARSPYSHHAYVEATRVLALLSLPGVAALAGLVAFRRSIAGAMPDLFAVPKAFVLWGSTFLALALAGVTLLAWRASARPGAATDLRSSDQRGKDQDGGSDPGQGRRLE